MKARHLALDGVLLLGRTYSEYEEFFKLRDLDLKGRKILDIASGVSSFCAEATEKGLDVTAVDPIYTLPPEVLLSRCQADLENILSQFPDVSQSYDWSFYRSIDHLKGFREEAYRRFWRHYTANRAKYLSTGLPKTDFAEGVFDLTLVSHFLFLYEESLGYQFHKQSLLELARITKGEIRIYPLTNMKAARSQFVDRLKEDQDCTHLEFEIQSTNFRFFKNSHEILLIRT